MNWLDEVKKVAISPEQIYENIISHHKPVTVYGASGGAKLATKCLQEHGIDVQGYFVSDEYYVPGRSFLGKPVSSYNEFLRGGGMRSWYRSTVRRL